MTSLVPSSAKSPIQHAKRPLVSATSAEKPRLVPRITFGIAWRPFIFRAAHRRRSPTKAVKSVTKKPPRMPHTADNSRKIPTSQCLYETVSKCGENAP